jgi:hypothetical protein
MDALKYLLSLAVTFATFLIFSETAMAGSNSTTVNVSIGSVSEITVSPTALNWTGVSPGTQGVMQSLNIKNTGSLNVTNIYAYVSSLSDEPNRPYGTGNAANYSTGALITFKNSTNTNYYFAGRIEWNWTSDPGNKDLSAFTSPVSYGFYKNTSFEYLWALGNGTGTGAAVYCNNSGAQLGVSAYADNGTTVTRTPAANSRDSGDANYGYWAIGSGPLSGSCVAAYYDCTKIYIYKYDKRNGFGSCSNAYYMQEEALVPGDAQTLTLSAFIPYGLPNGYLNQSTFTVVAT